MRVKLSKEEAEFIKSKFTCIDDFVDGTDRLMQTYSMPLVFIQSSETDKENDYFEIKHISDLPKETILEILRYIITKHEFIDNQINNLSHE